MSIPIGEQEYFEIQTVGAVAAGGSTSKQFIMTTHWRRTALVLAPSKSQIDTAYQAAVVVPMCAALNNRYTQLRNRVRCINDAADGYVDFSHAVVGAIAGDGMTLSQSAFVLGRTGLRGQANLAKKHLAPMSEADATAGTDDVFNAAALARLATFAAAWLVGFTDAGGSVWVPCVLAKSLSTTATNPTFIRAPDLISTAVNKRIGTMVHRKPKSVY